jgi:signal peptidase I
MNFLQMVKVSGDSMLPTLRSGKRALFIRVSKPGSSLVGKVVLIARINSSGSRDFYQIKRVKEFKDGKFFVVGDNESNSTDSRSFGYLTGDEIIGRRLL